MDYQRDYILRLIHMMGDFMRRLAERLDSRERERMLDETCRSLCGLSLQSGETLAVESLCEMLSPVPRLMLSDLLYAKATVCALPIEEPEALLYRALRLLASLHGEAECCDLRASRLAELKSAVFPMLNARDLMECARFFSDAERFDEMEDALFQALEREAGDASLPDRAEAIRLLRQGAHATEGALAHCGMTAQELRQSAFELESRASGD